MKPPSKQVLLFLVVVLLPGALLLGMAVRLGRQDRALATRHRDEARQLAAATLGQQLLAHLDHLRLEEMAAPGTVPAVALRGRWSEGRLLLPWDEAGVTSRPVEAEFEAALREAERLEFRGDAARAVGAYRAAIARARAAAAVARGRLGLARSLEKAGETVEATAVYRALLESAPEVRDEEGVQFALYACDRLWRLAPDERTRVADRLHQALSGAEPLWPVEAYLVRDIARAIAAEEAPESAADLLERSERSAATADQALALQRDASALLGLSRGAPRVGSRLWIPYGDPLWLVTAGGGPEPGARDSVLLAVSASAALETLLAEGLQPALAPGSARLELAAGEPLSAGLPGLRVVMPDVVAPEGSALPFLSLLLPLILGATAFTAYLLWRDVGRDVAAARLRGQFVSSVSHELKTPLTSIRMFAETLQRSGEDPERRRQYLETIIGESERLSRLINNVLDFSRVEEGGASYRREPVRLGDVARQAARAMAYPLARDGFTLNLDVGEDVVIAADQDALTQAVLNLLGNAVKFSGDAREIDLSVSASNGYALIRVTDRGIGVRDEHKDRIFEAFYRSPEAQDLGIPGTGLGLPLVRHVAQAHGGDIEVESRPGSGSTFTLRLPVEPAP